jgi:hypothetical protein
MAINIHTAIPSTPDASAGYDEIGLHANWGERVVTMVATSIAVLIVATIAVLMGMA